MTRKFTKPDYTATTNIQIGLGKTIPANHLARFVVMVAQLDTKQVSMKLGNAAAHLNGLTLSIFTQYVPLCSHSF
jgi:hypothetical protein